MKKNMLFIGGTHGDESIGVTVLNSLDYPRDSFDVVVGNPRALAKNTRFTDCDLNRSAPGNLSDVLYEKRRAAELIALSYNYQYTIDIHGAKNDMGTFIILTNPTKENWQLASLFSQIDRIVVWPSITPEMQYPLSEFFSCGLEIECGKKDAVETAQQLARILTTFLDEYDTCDMSDAAVTQRLAQKDLLLLYGKQPRIDGLALTSLNEFEQTTIDGEICYPSFIATYPYADVLCYKLKTCPKSALPF